jgi:pimeloyl-ACP methyl ester carboxylesterase
MHLCTHHGTGSTLIIALGGYRQDMRVFEPLIHETEKEFQWILVHLPYISPESNINTVYTSQELLHHIFTELNRYNYKKVYLLGFSIGGRIAQHLFLLAPEKFDQLILINSDGLKKHILQWISQKKWISETFLYRIIERKIWHVLINTLQKTRLISSKKAVFLLKHIQNTRRRKILIQIWKKYADYQTNLKSLSKYKNKVFLIWSKHDEVLPVQTAYKTVKKYNFALKIIEANHNIIEEHYKQLAMVIKSI